MKLLMVGDVVGGPGRTCLARVVTRMKTDREADFVVVNAENAAGGKGITEAIADEIFAAGVDAITLGDHTWDQRGVENYLDREERIVRPANFAPGCPGRGMTVLQSEAGPVAVLNLVGRVFMPPADCPFRAADELLAGVAKAARIVVVDFHAEATSEKIVLGRYLDGRASVFAGTHTHVQTSDETVLPKGTAYITDLGMTGPKDSAIGRDLATVTARFLNGMPIKFAVAERDVVLEGIVADIDDNNGRARSIRRIRVA
ncbi:MAG: TIGR00282 family metallophosphoesterase [Lentisphaerae bacterium]|nr:TIGR00282 family metallophosphoesterase [Lentisphaerota bacterium]